MPLFKVIKYDGDPHAFVWKHPDAELGTWTQLIVNESQEAVLFKGGQALDLFGPGRHTLETANIPILRSLVKIPFGGQSPFAAEVWYVNKVNTLDIKWGTPTPIQLQDPKYSVFVPVRAFGIFGIKIVDSKAFLVKLVGTLHTFTSKAIVDYFRGMYLTMVKDAIAGYLIKKKVPILEVNANILELSENLKESIAPKLNEFGIELVNFNLNDINVPDDDPAVIQLREALAKKAEMDIVGYTYAQERSFDTLEGAATNPGAAQAGLMGAGMGLGMGLGVGGAMGGQMSGLAQNLDLAEKKICPDCNAKMDLTARYCPSCSFDTQRAGNVDTTSCANCGEQFSKNYKFCPACSKSYIPCISCNADMKEDSAVCGSCGKGLPKPCPKCNTPLANENVKFCPECGGALICKCDGCGASLEGNPKFCPECGHKT